MGEEEDFDFMREILDMYHNRYNNYYRYNDEIRNGQQLWGMVENFIKTNSEKKKQEPKTLQEEYETREDKEAEIEVTPETLVSMIQNLGSNLPKELMTVIYDVLVTAEMSTCESAS